MNLKRMLRDASAQNLQWLLSDDTFEPSDKDWNKKDDLEYQWGYGDIEPHYGNGGTVKVYDDEVNETTQTRPVMEYAQQLIMRGVMGHKLLQALRSRFGKPILRSASAGPCLQKLQFLRRHRQMPGLPGRAPWSAPQRCRTAMHGNPR